VYCRYNLYKSTVRNQQLEAAIQKKILLEGTEDDTDIKDI